MISYKDLNVTNGLILPCFICLFSHCSAPCILSLSPKSAWKWKKERKILNIHVGLSVCSLQLLCNSLWEYSAHKKNHSGSGEMWGRRSPSGCCLCRLHLIGHLFGIFQVRPPFDHKDGQRGRLVHALVLLLKLLYVLTGQSIVIHWDVNATVH